MARDSYRDEYFTSSEIRWLARQTSLSINLLNQNIFNNHNLKLIYNTTVVFPPPKVNITYSAEEGLLTIDNSANNFSIGFELLDPSSEPANRIGFKTTVYNDKKTYYNFSSLYPFVDKTFNMVIAFAHNLCFLTPIDNLYKINGENLNKTGFLKYPIHDQTPNYVSTSPYVVYNDSANTDNLKFVGFPEYKINKGKIKEDIILNGYCDVKISQGQVNQYNLPYNIAGHKNNKELNLVNYCLPLFNNFDNPLYDNLQIKYENDTLYLKTPSENGKYKIGTISFNPETERLICYRLSPITTEPITADRAEDEYRIPWIKDIITNINCKDEKQTFKNFIAYNVSNSVFCLNENWNINCDFHYNTQRVVFASLMPDNSYTTLGNISSSFLDSEEWNFLISYTNLTKTIVVDHTWSYDHNGTSSSLGYGLFKIDNHSYDVSDFRKGGTWDNLTQNGYMSTYQYGSSDFGYILRGYKASITFKIQNFPTFRGKYINFSTNGIYDINNHTYIEGTHWYGTTDDKNYGVDKDNAIKYGFIESGSDFNGQSLLLTHNLLRVKNRGLIYRQGGNQPKVKNHNWTFYNGNRRITVGFSRYVDISIDKNSSLGLYALWLQTDDTTKQITWREYLE